MYHQRLREYRLYVNIRRERWLLGDRCFYILLMTNCIALCLLKDVLITSLLNDERMLAFRF